MIGTRPVPVGAAWIGLVLVVFTATLGCDLDVTPDLSQEDCNGHKGGEIYCRGGQVMKYQPGEGNWVSTEEVFESCSLGSSCYKDPRTGTFGCHVAEYTCPAGSTGYQCHGNRRIDCSSSGVAWDLGDCSWSAGSGAPTMTCVPNPGGKSLPCGFAAEKCTTPDEVRCLGNGVVVCRESVWQAYVPNTTTGQSTCDASKIRYGRCKAGSAPQYDSWCEGDQVLHCDRCVFYSDGKTDHHLCVAFTAIATCQPGATSP